MPKKGLLFWGVTKEKEGWDGELTLGRWGCVCGLRAAGRAEGRWWEIQLMGGEPSVQVFLDPGQQNQVCASEALSWSKKGWYSLWGWGGVVSQRLSSE